MGNDEVDRLMDKVIDIRQSTLHKSNNEELIKYINTLEYIITQQYNTISSLEECIYLYKNIVDTMADLAIRNDENTRSSRSLERRYKEKLDMADELEKKYFGSNKEEK